MEGPPLPQKAWAVEGPGTLQSTGAGRKQVAHNPLTRSTARFRFLSCQLGDPEFTETLIPLELGP